MQRAHRVVQGNKSATSTSIITRKMCFNFNDILKVEKEQHERNNFLANKLGQSFSREAQFSEGINMQRDVKTLDDVTFHHLKNKEPKLKTLAAAKTGNRFIFDKSPEMPLSKSKVVKDWHLSYNEVNLRNYTQFGVKSRNIQSQSNDRQQSSANINFAQTFFHKRLVLKSACSNEIAQMIRQTMHGPSTSREGSVKLSHRRELQASEGLRRQILNSMVKNRKVS